MLKPKFLYHASANKNIKLFEPRNENIRDPNEGPVIFASPSKIYCSMFIVRTDNSWAGLGKYNDTWYCAIADKDRFLALDKGGAIYKLSSKSFETELTNPTKDMEWVSKEAVKPIERELFDSGLEAMLNYNIKVYFVNKIIFRNFRENMEHNNHKKAFEFLFSQEEFRV